MSEAETPGVEAEDHRKQADYVAISRSHGSDRRLHKVKGDPDEGDLRNGESCEAACSTVLMTSDDWQAKPADVYPPGFFRLCTDPACFGSE